MQSRSQTSGFSPFIGFCFTVNYILGVGFLTIPWAFTQGGLILSSVVALLVGVVSDISKNFLLETMALAEYMLDERLEWRNYEEHLQLEHSADMQKCAATENSSLLETDDKKRLKSQTTVLLVKERKFEVNVLCRMFLGNAGQNLYTLSVFLYIYCALWAFTCVFASAMAKTAPLAFLETNNQLRSDSDQAFETVNYLVYSIIFALIVVPLTCMELLEQVWIQVLLTGARFLLLVLMLSTCFFCAATSQVHNDCEDDLEPAPWFRPAGISKMLPIMVFASIFQHGVPDLSQPVANKELLSPIFRSTCIFTAIAYVLLGITTGLAFGTNIEQSSNLNWAGFGNGSLTIGISYYIVCFPALDVVSAFPLNAITLGNNMFATFYGEDIFLFLR